MRDHLSVLRACNPVGMSGIADSCLACLSTFDRWCHITACLGQGRSREGIYEATLADNEREDWSDLLGYLENVRQSIDRSSWRDGRDHFLLGLY